MRVETNQLVPGCVLLNDVKGKSNRPIIPKRTVLTEEHIELLNNFLIRDVDVSSKLTSGATFTPPPIHKDTEKQEVIPKQQVDLPEALPFDKHFLQVVANYKKVFLTWQSHMPIDMPAIRKLLLPLIKRMDDNGNMVFTLQNLSTKKEYFYFHSVSVAVLSAFLAKQMGYPKKDWVQIGLAGFLSDAGMSKIDHTILTKEGSLTANEKEQIRMHPTYSYRLVEHGSTITNAVKLAVLQHHERVDGSGYPLGLSGAKLHTYARIIAICDMYHAMTSERLYQEKQSPFTVIEKLEQQQFSALDPTIVQTFIKSFAKFSVGLKVRLSNNQSAEIIYMETKQAARPIVRMENDGEIISLKNEPGLFINDILEC